LPKSTVKQISSYWFVFLFDKSKCQNNWLFLSSFDKIVLVKEVSNHPQIDNNKKKKGNSRSCSPGFQEKKSC